MTPSPEDVERMIASIAMMKIDGFASYPESHKTDVMNALWAVAVEVAALSAIGGDK